jgi:hypothetical protein
MKTRPASVHFRAKSEFSLSYIVDTNQCQIEKNPNSVTYKAISRVYPLTSLCFCDLDNAVSIKVCRD